MGAARHTGISFECLQSFSAICLFRWIDSLFEHEMFPGGPKLVLVGCEWAEVLENKTSTGLVMVRSNPPAQKFNAVAKFARLNYCVPYNLAFLPMDIERRDCKEFCVVDCTLKLGWGEDNNVL